MATRVGKEFASLEAAASADLNKAAAGWIGYATNSADQTGITVSTVAITNVTCTPTVGTNRLIKVSATAVVTAIGAGTATYYIAITQDGTNIGRIARVAAVPQNDVQFHSGFAWVVAPSAGAHTYALAITATVVGTSLTVDGSGGTAATILVEDCGSTT